MDDLILSKESKLYKLLYFFSNCFFTGWLVPRFGDSPKSRLFCLESVCTLVATLFKLILYLIFCAITIIYAFKTLFIFDLKLVEFSLFNYIGFIFKFVIGSLLAIGIILGLLIGFLILCEKVVKKIPNVIPNKKPFRLIKIYFDDKKKGICRRITVVDSNDKEVY